MDSSPASSLGRQCSDHRQLFASLCQWYSSCLKPATYEVAVVTSHEYRLGSGWVVVAPVSEGIQVLCSHNIGHSWGH